jgi:hypothetical protein
MLGVKRLNLLLASRIEYSALLGNAGRRVSTHSLNARVQ